MHRQSMRDFTFPQSLIVELAWAKANASALAGERYSHSCSY